MHRTWLVPVGFIALAFAIFVSRYVYRASQSETASARDADVVSKLAGTNADSRLPGLIPHGMRVVSVRVNDTVARFVVPGMRVDVLLTGTAGGINKQRATTILENVVVLAAGTRLERNSAGEPQQAAVVTLLVSPQDAQKLTLTSSEGHIQLVLRNRLDQQQPRQREPKPIPRLKPIHPADSARASLKAHSAGAAFKPTSHQTGVTSQHKLHGTKGQGLRQRSAL